MDACESKPPQKIFWLKLPGWADEVPEDRVFHMLEDVAVRNKIPLTPYDPNDKNKGKGRKIVLLKKTDHSIYQCSYCGKKNEHYSFGCPDHPDQVEQVVIDGVMVERKVVYCRHCKIKDDHSTWKCPVHPPVPFRSFSSLICEICGVEDEHTTEICPKRRGVWPGKGKPIFMECWICGMGEERDHWTVDCPVLANGDRKVCFICARLDHHWTEDCADYKPPVLFCMCCGSKGDHKDKDCPREFNDGRKYCGICDEMCDHSTENCVLAEPRAGQWYFFHSLMANSDRVTSSWEPEFELLWLVNYIVSALLGATFVCCCYLAGCMASI